MHVTYWTNPENVGRERTATQVSIKTCVVIRFLPAVSAFVYYVVMCFVWNQIRRIRKGASEGTSCPDQSRYRTLICSPHLPPSYSQHLADNVATIHTAQ